MTDDSMAFTASLTDPDEIDWQFSLGGTALDKVDDPRFPGMSALEACLRLLCESHAAGSSGQPSSTEERSLRLLVEDALGSVGFQKELLPRLVAVAIEANNLFLVELLLSYAESEEAVLALAKASGSGAPQA